MKSDEKSVDMVNHPPHYKGCGTCHHCGGDIEVIDVTEGMNFVLGNAAKYILRADKKFDAIEDLKKAVWYLNREIENREKNAKL